MCILIYSIKASGYITMSGLYYTKPWVIPVWTYIQNLMHLFAFSSHSSPSSCLKCLLQSRLVALWSCCPGSVPGFPYTVLISSDALSLLSLHLKKKKKQNYHDGKVSGYKRLGFRERVNCTGAQGNLERGVNWNVLYYKCGSGDMSISICQN